MTKQIAVHLNFTVIFKAVDWPRLRAYEFIFQATMAGKKWAYRLAVKLL